MKKYIKAIFSLSLLLSLTNCSEDDATGLSNLEIGDTPTLTVDVPQGKSNTLIEGDVVFPFTITTNEAKPYDINITVNQIGGDAVAGTDFTMPASLRLPAYATSITGEIAILSDDIIEATETLNIEIGAITNNSNITPILLDFTILNYTEGDLLANLSWAASELTTDNSGTEIEATDLADMRLLVTDVPYSTIIKEEDGAAFETITLDATTPDGEYYIVADFFSASEIPADLDLTISFDQAGVINGETYTFPAALNTGSSCGSVYFIMAKVIKSGTSYTVSEIGETNLVSAAPFIGTATILVDEWEDYAAGDTVEIEAGSSPNEFWIRSYSNSVITNPSTAYLIVTIDPLTSSVTVVSNEDYEYGCSEGDIIGSGTVDECTGTIDIILDFDLGDCGAYPAYQLILEL